MLEVVYISMRLELGFLNNIKQPGDITHLSEKRKPLDPERDMETRTITKKGTRTWLNSVYRHPNRTITLINIIILIQIFVKSARCKQLDVKPPSSLSDVPNVKNQEVTINILSYNP